MKNNSMRAVVMRKMADGTWHIPTWTDEMKARRAQTMRAKAIGNAYLVRRGNKIYRQVMTADGKRYEHRLIMESVLGRRLERWEQVHHINEDGLDNRPENLELKTIAEHTSHHFKGKPKSAEHRAKIGVSGRLTRAKRAQERPEV